MMVRGSQSCTFKCNISSALSTVGTAGGLASTSFLFPYPQEEDIRGQRIDGMNRLFQIARNG